MYTRLATFALYLGIPYSVATAQINDPVRLQTLPEEVLITGDRSLQNLRMQMLEAEKKAYDVFNKFNDEKRFNISCSVNERTGSRFSGQVCTPNFQIEATAAHGQGYWDTLQAWLDPYNYQSGHGYSPQMAHQPMEAVIASQMKDYQAKLRKIAMEHPEFLEAIMQYGELRQQYQSATGIAPDR